MSGAGERGGEPAVSLKTWIAVGGALLGAFLAVLNIQITNTALPYIEGGISTGGVYGTWISTAYLIGEIIVVPLTDFLSRVFSLRRYLLVNTVLFLVFSVLCGHAHSLGEMIVFRALQGFHGRRPHSPRLYDHPLHAAAVEARGRPRRLCRHRHVRACDRPDDRRLSERHLRLALGVLRQSCAGRTDAGRALVRFAKGVDGAPPAASGRLARHRADGGRPRHAADGAGRRQRLRLVRLALYRQAEPGRGGRARRLRRARVLCGRTGRQFPAARTAQFRLGHAWTTSCSASPSTPRPICCPSISPRLKGSMPSRAARSWRGPDCRNCWSSRWCRC